MKNDSFFMQKCLELAQKGFPNNSPNPMVGSVIVFEGTIIGEGFHEKYGSHHAEVNAINSVRDKSLLSKSTLYVNLEPCAHFGNTAPCSDLIIKHNIPKVVIGCIDVFSEVSGKGIEKMKNAGIKIVTGVMEEQSKVLNKRFFTFHEKQRPYIILKWAKSKDGFIAPKNQKEPFWMTSEESRQLVHQWRAEETAVLVGRITVEKDNPLLTVRSVSGQNPIRIVIDKNLQLSNKMNLFNDEAKTIFFNDLEDKENTSNLFIKIRFNNLIKNILDVLHKQTIQSVIIEGGSKTLQSFINANMWDETRIFTTNRRLKNGVRSPEIEGEIIAEEKIGRDLLEIIHNR